MYPKRRVDVTTRQIEDEALVLDRHAGKIHQLNATASYIWSRCDGMTSSGEISQGLATEFAISPESAERDVADTLAKLVSLELVRVNEETDVTGHQTSAPKSGKRGSDD
jgi:hypothetical protein